MIVSGRSAGFLGKRVTTTKIAQFDTSEMAIYPKDRRQVSRYRTHGPTGTVQV